MGTRLREKGYSVETTNDFADVPSRYNLQDFDLITMGGQVPAATKGAIMQAATAVQPAMRFVQGMAAIPGLVVDQIEGELHAERRKSEQVPQFEAPTRTLHVVLTDTARLTVTVWWQTTFVPPDPGSDSRLLCDETRPAGQYSFALPAEVPDEYSFATVYIDDAAYALKLA